MPMLTATDFTTEQLADGALALTKEWEANPQSFYQDVLGVEAWEKQVEIVNAIRDYRRVSVKSCHGSGKSWNGGSIVPWFLSTYPDSIVLTTAPTFRQVRDILWREIRSRFNGARIPIARKINQTELNMGDTWFAIGLSTNEPDKFQGYHAEHLLVLVDEAAGVDEDIFQAVDAVLTAKGNRLCMLGNPTSGSGTFYNSHRDRSTHKIKITAWDTPNFSANNITGWEQLCALFHPESVPAEELDKYEPDLIVPNANLISPVWVHEKVHTWGPNSPMFQSRVEAEFPIQGERTLIPLPWLEAAMSDKRRLGDDVMQFDEATGEPLKDHKGRFITKHIPGIAKGKPVHGVDVARFGSDRTAILYRLGDNVQWIKAYSKQDTMETAATVQFLLNKDHEARVRVDVIGVGSGVVDRLEEYRRTNAADQRHRVYGVNVALPCADDEDKVIYFNTRSRLYWRLREKFERGEIALPNDQTGWDLVDELSCMEFEYRSGKLYVEEKADIKKRLGKSPDLADALMLSYADEGQAAWADLPNDEHDPHKPDAADPDDAWEPPPRAIVHSDPSTPVSANELDAIY